ncbi:hypothetical protein M3Y97_00158900 [Aphelenchoides bicaudatus]|nr:hypothetical protein M3Y97_00158900 [Aphelenchoides bicaudatus]
MAYVLGYFAIYAISVPDYLQKRGDTLRTYVLIIWMLQIWLSMALLFYWECREENKHVLESSLKYETMLDHFFRTDWFTRLFLFGFCILFFVRVATFVLSLFAGLHSPDRIIMFEILTVPFGSGFGVVFTSAIVIHMFLVLFVVLLYYGIPGFAIRYRLLFLKQELERLGELRQDTQSTISFYTEYKSVLKNTQFVNQHFQVYRMMSVACCFGCIVVLIFMFIREGDSKRWQDFLHLSIEVVMIILIIMCLVYCPSAIKSTLGNVKYILFFNSSLWLPYDQQTYELNNLYADMAELVENSISVWGISQLARKPLVATIAAVGVIIGTSLRFAEMGFI